MSTIQATYIKTEDLFEGCIFNTEMVEEHLQRGGKMQDFRKAILIGNQKLKIRIIDEDAA